MVSRREGVVWWWLLLLPVWISAANADPATDPVNDPQPPGAEKKSVTAPPPVGPDKKSADDLTELAIDKKALTEPLLEEDSNGGTEEAGTLHYESITGEELSVTDVLRRVEEQSPQIRGAAMREVQYNDLLFIQRSNYVPYIEGGLGVQWPGTASNGIPEYGLAQPNFSHPGAPDAGLWTLYKAFDLTREYGVLAAKHQAESTGFRTRVIRYQVYQAALQAYFDAARYRSYVNTYQHMQTEINGLIHTVRRLVKAGQHTVVALMLLEDQATESYVRSGVYLEEYHSAIRRLALQLGTGEKEIAAPASTKLEESVLNVIHPGDQSPVIEQAAADVRVAESNVSKAAAQHAPTIWFAGSAGAVSGGIASNYNAAFALTIPVFEGFRINADTDRAQAQQMEAKHALDTAKLTVNDQNERYDKIIHNARFSLHILAEEKAAGYEALRIAKTRYIYFLGSLADIREGIRNLMRIETSINDAKADLLNALAAKAFLNGGTVTHF
jgi:outer membrane protein TolC